MSLYDRTRDACDQLLRYGNEIACEELLAVVEQITDINDDLWHGRDPSIIREGIERAKALLDLVPIS